MRKIIFAQIVSLDGFIEDPDGKIDWTIPSEELHRHFNELEKNLDINFYGRGMSEVMDYWLTADQNPQAQDVEVEYARYWKETERYVFSKTLDKVEGNARLIREIDPEEIRKLKIEQGNDMAVGGPNLASEFIRYNLVDEIRLYIQPVILGGGKPMFPVEEKLNLEFVESHRFSGGVVMLKYRVETRFGTYTSG